MAYVATALSLVVGLLSWFGPREKANLSAEQVWLVTADAMSELHLATANRCDEVSAGGAPERGLIAIARELGDLLCECAKTDRRGRPPHGELADSLDLVLNQLYDLAECELPDTVVLVICSATVWWRPTWQ